MVLPSSLAAAAILLIVCAICWALWFWISKRATAGWRYEVYYLDVCAGLLLTSILIVGTFGTLGPDMTFGDRWLVAGLRSKAWVVSGGVALALGNFLFLASLSLKSKRAPLFAIVAALVLNFSWIYRTRGGTVIVAIVVLVLLLLAAVLYSVKSAMDKTKPAKLSDKARALAFASAIFGGGFYPLARSGIYTDIDLGPYGALLLLAVTVCLSSLFFSIYFFNLPVNGPPVGFLVYRTSPRRKHLTGIFAGALYSVALVTMFLGLSVVAGSES